MKQITLYEKICNLGSTFDISLYSPAWSLEDICRSIEEKDELFGDFLVSLNNYGVYDMLVAICEIVSLFCSNDNQNWFYEQLRQCPDSDMILQMANTFYQKRVTDLQVFNELNKNFDKLQNKPNIILEISFEQFESYIWECYDPNFLRKIARDNPRNIGVWFPMIYAKSTIEKHINKLEENAFPYLIMCAKDIIEIGSEDKIKKVLVRKRIADYLCELGLFYYPNIEHAVNPLIELDPKLVAESDYNEYAQMIQNILEKELGYRLYITKTMTDYLREMIRISEYFGDSSYRKNVLEMKIFLPLFYQLIGREEEAIALLIDTIKSFPVAAYQVNNSHLE